MRKFLKPLIRVIVASMMALALVMPTLGAATAEAAATKTVRDTANGTVKVNGTTESGLASSGAVLIS